MIPGMRAIPPGNHERGVHHVYRSTCSVPIHRRPSFEPLTAQRPKDGRSTGIEQLAELIAAEGVLQNLDVYECDEGEGKKKTTHAVVAGGRRWRALQLLIRQKRIKPDYAVPCLVVSRERAVQISLAENSGREPMHPADEFDAFRQLIDAGQSVEDVAARFGVAPLVVQRRLKLANVGPTFIALYREGEITLEHLMALAVTDDHARQQQAWDRSSRTRGIPELCAASDGARSLGARSACEFVGIKTYEKAGGVVRRDLFDEEDEGVMLDGELLRQLAAQKLEKHAAKLQEEVSRGSRFARSGATRIAPIWPRARRAASADGGGAGAARWAECASHGARGAARGGRGGRRRAYAALSEQIEALDAELDAFDEARSIIDPAQQACAGAVVSIGHDGKLSVEKNLLKPEDANASLRGESARPRSRRSAIALRRARTPADRAPHARPAGGAGRAARLALVALTHRLVLKTFSLYGFTRASVVEIDARSAALAPHAEELAGSKAHGALQSRREALEGRLPKDEQELFAWLLQQPQRDVLTLLAFCVAQSVDGVTDSETRGAVDELARAAALDMREPWRGGSAQLLRQRVTDARSGSRDRRRVGGGSRGAREAQEGCAGAGGGGKGCRHGLAACHSEER